MDDDPGGVMKKLVKKWRMMLREDQMKFIWTLVVIVVMLAILTNMMVE